MHLFANVGFTPQMITPSIRRRPDLKGIVLFHGAEPEATKAVEVVQEQAAKFGIPVRRVRIDVFDPTHSFEAYVKEYRRVPAPREIIFNTAGGTGVVTSAATAFCIALRIPFVYVRRDNQEEVEFPRTLFGYWFRYLESHTEILRQIGKGHNQVTELAAATKYSQGRISVLVQDLEKGGYVKSTRTGREKHLVLTEFASIVLEANELRGHAEAA